MFSIGDKVKVINDKVLKGLVNGPKLEIGSHHVVKNIVLDKENNQHLDIGIVSLYNYIKSYETREDLPNGDNVQWCHPSRFEKVN